MKHLTIFAACLLLFGAAACSDNDERQPYNPAELTVTVAYTDVIELAWTAQPDAVGYDVEYSSKTGVRTVHASGTRCELTGLDADTDYSIRMRPLYEDAQGMWSEPVRVTTASFSVSVSSYNVLGVESKALWAPRAGAVGAIIRRADHDPDILCLQECKSEPIYSSVQELLADDYDVHTIATSRADAGPALIFWKKDRFELVKGGYTDMLLGDPKYSSGDFTPNRYAHFVQLREKHSGHELLVYSIHVKTNGASVSYQQLRYDCISALCPAAIDRASKAGGIPVFIMGDFNNYMTTVDDGVISAPAACIEGGFTESAAVARECVNLGYKTSGVDMVNGKAEIRPDGNSRIDYIFCRYDRPFSVSKYRTVIDFIDGSATDIRKPVPSDHHPVNAVFHLSYR